MNKMKLKEKDDLYHLNFGPFCVQSLSLSQAVFLNKYFP